MALGYTSSADNNGSLVSNLNVIFLAGNGYVDREQLSSNPALLNAPTVYTASIDNITFTPMGGGNYVIDASYTSSLDVVNFGINLGGNYVIDASYTSSLDATNFVSFGGSHVPWGYTDQSFTNVLVGIKNPTNGYTDTSNLLSSNLTGLKSTQALPVYIQFSSAIPNIRLNIPNNVPFLKQVFVE